MEIQNNKFLKILNLSRWVYGKTWVELVHVLTTAVSLTNNWKYPGKTETLN